MSQYEEFVELTNGMSKIALEAIRKFNAFIQREQLGILDIMEADIARYKETGVLVASFGNLPSNTEEMAAIEEIAEEVTQPKRRGRTKQKTNPSGRSSSLKENSREPQREQSRATGQRKAMVESSRMFTNTTTVNSTLENVMIKVERLTEQFIQKNHGIANLPIKQEKIDMPPPSMPVRQTRKRKGTQNTTSNLNMESVRIKAELIDTESKKRKARTKPAKSEKYSVASKNSDVFISPEPIDTVNLVDTDDEEPEKASKTRGRPKGKQKVQRKDTNSSADEQKTETEVSQPTRVTRTKTRNAAKNKEADIEEDSTVEKQKRVHSSSTDDEKEKKTSKRTKARKGETSKKRNEETYVCEDVDNFKKVENSSKIEIEQTTQNTETVPQAEAQPSQILNATMVLNKPALLNTTVVVEKPKNPVLMNETMVINKLPNGHQQHIDDLMTDDEDVVASPVKAQKIKKVKQVFSPYANSPVKKRVEAFEKLGAEANSELPLRMTRTKTKAKEQTVKENGLTPENEGSTENIPSTVKYGAIPKLQYTPLPDHRTPLHSTTITKQKTSQSAQLSGLKLSQAEFRERELRRQQKEAEALSKKEALIQAQTEERRRKREERQLKAQMMREALEKDKKKTLESAERQKQEKIKQLKAEKEEKLLKQREETARKRALAMKKATEEKQKEEERKKLEERKRLEVERKKLEGAANDNKGTKVPPYLKYETPLLPTEDCYDSDDSNASKPFSTPTWQKKEVLVKVLRYMRYIDVKKRTLFCNGPETVNLREIFPSIELHKLKRTSSAIWNKSGLATLSSMAEEDEYHTT